MSATTKSPTLRDTVPDLRLRLVEDPGRESLDGGWWPRSRDLTLELRALADGFPRGLGRVTRVGFSRPDWDSAPRQVDLGTRVLKVGSFPDDDTHVLIVQTGDRHRFTLLVVPPSFTDAQGEEALLAASTAGNSHSATEVLAEVTDKHPVDPAQLWRD